jgi:hypothetical protein
MPAFRQDLYFARRRKSSETMSLKRNLDSPQPCLHPPTPQTFSSNQPIGATMARQRKRTIEDVDVAEFQAEQQRSIKRKIDAAAMESNQSDTSYVSAAAAIFSDADSDGSAETARTEVEELGSEESSDEEEDSSDDSSSESDEEASDVDDTQQDEEITIVRPGVKPEITRVPNVGAGLLDRLKSFLPEMEKANGVLEKERAAGTLGERSLEIVGEEEDGPYIEMVGSTVRQLDGLVLTRLCRIWALVF